jgi:hypothetical protein
MTYEVDLIEQMNIAIKSLVRLGGSDPCWDYKPPGGPFAGMIRLQAYIGGEQYETAEPCPDADDLEEFRERQVRAFERTLARIA